MSELLKDVRVLEFGQLLGPDSVGMILADHGADVIKVESPFLGDYIRDVGTLIAPHVSLMHVQINKGKRSITLNLKDADARTVFWSLLDTADVFIDGTVAGAAEKLGIGYAAQRERKPDIIYCHYTAFGIDGPYAKVPAHGLMFGALAGQYPQTVGQDGLLHLDTDATPATSRGGEPSAAGAIHAALGIMGALFQRERLGAGGCIDVAATDAVVAQGWFDVVDALNRHRAVDQTTSEVMADMAGARYNYYMTRDHKVVMLAAIEPKFWERFCGLVDRSDLIGDPLPGNEILDFGVDVGLRTELTKVIATKSLQEWMDLVWRHHLPLGPAPRTLGEWRDDPHNAFRRMVISGSHPVIGPFDYIASPVRAEGQPYAIRRPAPALGEHTREILAELGLSENEITHLDTRGSSGVVNDPVQPSTEAAS